MWITLKNNLKASKYGGLPALVLPALARPRSSVAYGVAPATRYGGRYAPDCHVRYRSREKW